MWRDQSYGNRGRERGLAHASLAHREDDAIARCIQLFDELTQAGEVSRRCLDLGLGLAPGCGSGRAGQTTQGLDAGHVAGHEAHTRARQLGEPGRRPREGLRLPLCERLRDRVLAGAAQQSVDHQHLVANSQ